MKRKINLIFLIIPLVIYGCLPMDQTYSIEVKNNSSQTICVYGAYILPDTSPSQNIPDYFSIEPGKSGYLLDSKVGDEKFSRLASEKLTVFFLSKDTVDKYNWSIIRNDYKILERREILEKDLENGVLIRYP